MADFTKISVNEPTQKRVILSLLENEPKETKFIVIDGEKVFSIDLETLNEIVVLAQKQKLL